MRRKIWHSALLLATILVAATPLACSRQRSGARRAPAHPPGSASENPAAIPHPCPPQPTGPQTAGRDSLLNRFRPKLEPWAALWAEAQPGFGLDSTWLVARRHWGQLGVVAFEPPTKETPDDVTFEILGLRSPDGVHTLNVDSYQLIEPAGDTLEVGGEPDSRCTLIDHRTRREAVLEFSGTSGGYHWGAWLTPDAFAVGAWLDADDYGQWKQATLSIYTIPDSTESVYQSRIVSAADYERYMRAWHRWLLGRYRSLRSKPAT